MGREISSVICLVNTVGGGLNCEASGHSSPVNVLTRTLMTPATTETSEQSADGIKLRLRLRLGNRDGEFFYAKYR